MCDYSLMHFPNRLAAEGEQLQVHRFRTGSKGFVCPAELAASDAADKSSRGFWARIKDCFNPVIKDPTAVCIPPGARLKLHGISAQFGMLHDVHSEEEVTFEELTAIVNSYRDAICFANGEVVLLQDLEEGQRATVLAMGADREEIPAIREQAELSRRAA